MPETFAFRFGEFPSNLCFYTSGEDLFAGLDVVSFDQNTFPLFAKYAQPQHRVVWPAGEAHKDLSSIEQLLEVCLSAGLGRDSTLGGAGGGVVTDMAAFAASLYMRGCRLVLIPTTLLAMVDAAVGGKTGVDFGGYKNIVGTFYPANEVRIWTGALKSLSEREYLSGLAEVIKHGLLGANRVWDLVKEQRPAVLARQNSVLDELVREAVLFKARVVEKDLREVGERAFLNLGHTFAHALEAVLNFDGTLSHGEAVAWGMDRALSLGVRLGVTDPQWKDEVHELLTAYGYRLRLDGVLPEEVLGAMKNDKKKKSGTVRFVLQKSRGETLLQPVDDKLVLKTIQEGL
ncbi:MAG: 3-dehydroquinate synthase [Spirochaetales bacterium]|nr:3-dehydroquinate synthase [Spirochaetales bacterium]